MNILFLANFPFTGAGGVGRVTQVLTAEFRARGHECTWLAIRRGDAHTVSDVVQLFTPSDAVASRVNVDYLQGVVRERNIDVIVNQAGIDLNVIDLIRPVATLCRVFTVHHNCVTCLQELHGSIIDRSLDRIGVPRFLRLPPIYALLKSRSRHRIGRAFQRIAKEHVRLVLLSKQFIPELRVFSGKIDDRRVIAIPNPAPFAADETALDEKEHAMLFVGRLANDQKRVDRLLEVWRAIMKDFPGWRLDIVGDGPDRGWLEELADKMNLERVRFHGRQDPVPFYRNSRCLLMTSDFEGFGMVLIEAQAFGCIPIALKCFASIGDVVLDETTGYLVERGDLAHFTRRLREVMLNPDGVTAMGLHAIEHSTKFSPRSIADQWLSAFATAD